MNLPRDLAVPTRRLSANPLLHAQRVLVGVALGGAVAVGAAGAGAATDWLLHEF